jgi:hypothetical protein
MLYRCLRPVSAAYCRIAIGKDEESAFLLDRLVAQGIHQRRLF